MSELKRVVPVLLAHFILGLAVCEGYAFLAPVMVPLINPFVTGYRVREGILLFITWMPALQISGLLVGYALAFGKTDAAVGRWSGTLLSYLKGAFVVCLVSISLYVVLVAGIAPSLSSRQNEVVSRTGDYHDALDAARQAVLDGNYSEAEFQSSVALQLWSASHDATELHEQIKYHIASTESKKSDAFAKKESAPAVGSVSAGSLLPGAAGMTVLRALDRADAAMKIPDFYTAHYYAMMAYQIAAPTDPNREKALRVGSAAWNKISEGLSDNKMGESRDLYNTKRKGYDAIQSGDYLSAYYIFQDLYSKELSSGDKKSDPDVARFLLVAKQGMLGSFFFMDETGNMKQFEAARDIFFTIHRKDGSSDVVFIKGVSWVRSGGKDMAYLREVEYARVGWDGALQYRIAVPYAKMFPYADAGGIDQPELLLHAVDRARKGVETRPRVIAGDLPDADRNILLLPMPFRDFSRIVEANKGAASMSIIDLLKFEQQADSYGFSSKLLRCEVINRLVDPFLMLILSIYALIIAWRFRLGQNVLFKAWWSFALPLFPLLSIFAMDLVRYAARLCVLSIVQMVPQNPVILVLILLSLWFVAVSVYFFAQRSD